MRQLLKHRWRLIRQITNMKNTLHQHTQHMIHNITTLISAWIRDIWVSLYVSESEDCVSLSSVVICVSYLLWNLSLHYAKITQTLLSNDLSTPSVCSDKLCILSSQSSPVIGSLLFSFTTSTPSWVQDQVNVYQGVSTNNNWEERGLAADKKWSLWGN